MRHGQLTTCRLATAAMAAVIGATALGTAADDEVQLSPRRYTDKLNGFSLRPPLATEQRREPSPSRLVRWIHRDDKTRAIDWTLSVIRLVEKKAEIDLKEYARALAAKLRADDSFQVDSAEVIQVAGKGAIDVRGVTGGMVRMWQRQVWIFARPRRFIILMISGPQGAKGKLQKIHQTVLDTVKLTDPLVTLAAEKKNLLRGRRFLASLRGRKLSAAAQMQWFVIRLKDQPVGWMLQTESLAKTKGPQGQKPVNGIEVKTWTMTKFPKDRLRLQRRVMFSSQDGQIERWHEVLQVGQGPSGTVIKEDGIRQAELIVCTITQGGRQKTHKKTVPRDPNRPRDEIYLPRAIGMILPRLLDLSKPAAYAFASYSSQINDFELRTVTVIGPERISIGDRRVDAVRATDVVGANEELATEWWVDAKGLLLRMKSAGDLTVETSSRREIVKLIPAADKYIQEALRQK